MTRNFWLWWFEMYFCSNIIILSFYLLILFHSFHTSQRTTEFWNKKATHFLWASKWLFDLKPGIKIQNKTFWFAIRAKSLQTIETIFWDCKKNERRKKNRETHKHDKHVSFDVEKQNNRDNISIDMTKIRANAWANGKVKIWYGKESS